MASHRRPLTKIWDFWLNNHKFKISRMSLYLLVWWICSQLSQHVIENNTTQSFQSCQKLLGYARALEIPEQTLKLEHYIVGVQEMSHRIKSYKVQTLRLLIVIDQLSIARTHWIGFSGFCNNSLVLLLNNNSSKAQWKRAFNLNNDEYEYESLY